MIGREGAAASHTLVRHQAAALAATLLDFSVMVLCVSGASLAPAAGTAIGAAAGGTLSFALGRHWIFSAAAEDARWQAARYASVSLGSLLLNAGGEHALASVLGVPYVGARLLVAITVGLLWNYPMQSSFVFRRGPR